MKAAKIVSIIGGVFYSIVLVSMIFTTSELVSLYNDQDMGYNPAVLVNLLSVILVIANFGYFYYLTRKEKKEEEVKNALLFSILIAGVPLFLLPMITVFLLVFPIYNITSDF